MLKLENFLLLSAVLFSAGLACVLIRRNIIQMLMGVELILNSAALNFVAFAYFTPEKIPLSGHVFSVFIIVLAAAEAAVALALVLAVFRMFGTVDIESVKDLKG